MNGQSFVITGSNTPHLEGSVAVKGAKNAVLKMMAASLLFKDTLRIENVPKTEDVTKLVIMLRGLGATVLEQYPVLEISAPEKIQEMDQALSKTMRSSVVLTGPMLSRYGRTEFPAPGGCVIGTRPVDLFIEGYKTLGATVVETQDVYKVSGKISGGTIVFPFQTVTGTETLAMAAILAQGTTTLINCALEPEIQSLLSYLVSCGANISGIGTTTLTIQGGTLLESQGKPYITIPDRIETGSYLALGAVAAKKLTITNTDPKLLDVPIYMLRKAGVQIETTNSTITVSASPLTSFNIRTHEYPGFPTDLQAPFVTLLTQATGEGIVFETIFEGRFKFIEDLISMGADVVTMNPREVLVRGPKKLKAPEQQLVARDIRAGFAAVMAALISEGETTISNVVLVDRGYEGLEKVVTDLGGRMKRV